MSSELISTNAANSARANAAYFNETPEVPLEGGKRMKKPSKKMAAKPKPAPKKHPKKGGDGELLQQVSGLAVPFAFLLAKQGLEAMKDKKKSVKPSSKKASVGGSCPSCAPVDPTPVKVNAVAPAASKVNAPAVGGRNKEVSTKLNRLRKNIDDFLRRF